MEKKFELVMEDSIVVEGRTLYRIRALKNVVESDDGTYAVKNGTLGGYVQKKRIYLTKEIAGYLIMLKYSTMLEHKMIPL